METARKITVEIPSELLERAQRASGGKPEDFMKKGRCKSPRRKLDSDSYRKLHRQVLERDGWRCQACGSMHHLQIHHLLFRSHSGGDTEHNLITLCVDCHHRVHLPGI